MKPNGRAMLRIYTLTLSSFVVREARCRITEKRVYINGRTFDRATLRDVSAKAVRLNRRVDLISYGMDQ